MAAAMVNVTMLIQFASLSYGVSGSHICTGRFRTSTSPRLRIQGLRQQKYEENPLVDL